jgi:hypothetical protein
MTLLTASPFGAWRHPPTGQAALVSGTGHAGGLLLLPARLVHLSPP